MVQLIFLHIPKTAGTSIMSSLYERLGHETVYWVGHRREQAEFFDATDYQKFAGYKVLGGHIELQHAMALPGPKIIFSVLREPIGRALSLYNFIANTNPQHYLHEEIKGLGLSKAIRRSSDFRHLVKHAQCRVLSGTRDHKSAVRNILQAPCIISTDAQHVMDQMSDFLGMDRFDLPRANAAPNNYKQDRLLSFDYLLHRITAEDRKLFRLVRDGRLPSASSWIRSRLNAAS